MVAKSDIGSNPAGEPLRCLTCGRPAQLAGARSDL